MGRPGAPALRAWGWAVVLGLASIGACTGKKSDPSPSYVPTSQKIGASGGRFTTPEGVTVSVPAGALVADTTITVALVSDALPSATPAAGPMFLFGPEGTVFAKSVTLTLPIDARLLPEGATVRSVRVMTAPRDSSTYLPLDARPVDATHVQIATTHFSKFGSSLAPPVSCAPCSRPSYDACITCGSGFHFYGPASSPCAPSVDRVGLGGTCREDCNDGTNSGADGYATDCGYWCAPGYHAAEAIPSSVLGCAGIWFHIACEPDKGLAFDSCDWGCPPPYVRDGAGFARCTDALGEPSAGPTSHCVVATPPSCETKDDAGPGTQTTTGLPCTPPIDNVVCHPPGFCQPNATCWVGPGCRRDGSCGPPP